MRTNYSHVRERTRLQNWWHNYVLVNYKAIILATIPNSKLFFGEGVKDTNLPTETDNAVNLQTEMIES